MAHNVHVDATARSSAIDAITAVIGTSGLLRVYDGTQPANVAAALSGNTLLVTCALTADAFPDASAGSSTANAIANGTIAATGTASWASLLTSGGTRKIDFTVGVGSGFDLNVDTVSLVAAATFIVDSFVASMAA